MEDRTSDREYKCNTCNKIFPLKSALSRHRKAHQMQKIDKQVGYNSYKTLLKQLRIRRRLHDHLKNTGNPQEINTTQTKKVSELYKNVISETIYSSDSDCEYALIQTIIKIDPSKNSSSECKYCKKKFTKPDSLNRHIIRHIKDLTITSDAATPPDNENQNLEATKPEQSSNGLVGEPIEISNTSKTKAMIYPCQECNKTFKYACNLTNHQKYHLKQSSVSNIQHVSNLNSKFGRLRFSCSYCNKVYSKRLHLENHEIVHKDKNLVNVNARVGENGGVKNTHLCMFCGKKFTKSSHLSVHIKIHLNDKSHLCSFCGKSFTLKRYLEIHQRTHTRERPFTCEQCHKGFIHKSSLVEHLRIHTGIKPHICSFCDKKFTHYSGLTQHLRTHTDDKEYVCGICGKAFRFGGHYREHIRIHSGDKPYNCGSCNRSFTSRSSLVVHLRIHSGERPYQCMACKKGFIKSYGLTQHRKTHVACNSMYENKNTV